jgi:NhaA family Na+:H+ antiporter
MSYGFVLHDAGLHATSAGVILALVTPARPPAKLHRSYGSGGNHPAIRNPTPRRRIDADTGPSEPRLRALDAIHDRIESPRTSCCVRLNRGPSYVVLPIFRTRECLA